MDKAPTPIAPTHSPGPWRIAGQYIVSSKDYAPGHPLIIARMLRHRPGSADRVPFGVNGDGDQVGNAALIEAAPDLLELAKLLQRTVEFELRRSEKTDDDEGTRLKRITLHMIRTKIAKAEGRTEPEPEPEPA